jgi:hypothetical protein
MRRRISAVHHLHSWRHAGHLRSLRSLAPCHSHIIGESSPFTAKPVVAWQSNISAQTILPADLREAGERNKQIVPESRRPPLNASQNEPLRHIIVESTAHNEV